MITRHRVALAAWLTLSTIAAHPQTETRRDARPVAPTAEPKLLAAGDLAGANLLGVRGELAGRCVDVVLRPHAGDVHAVVVECGEPTAAAAKKLVLVGLDEITCGAGGTLRIAHTRAGLRRRAAVDLSPLRADRRADLLRDATAKRSVLDPASMVLWTRLAKTAALAESAEVGEVSRLYVEHGSRALAFVGVELSRAVGEGTRLAPWAAASVTGLNGPNQRLHIATDTARLKALPAPGADPDRDVADPAFRGRIYGALAIERPAWDAVAPAETDDKPGTGRKRGDRDGAVKPADRGDGGDGATPKS